MLDLNALKINNDGTARRIMQVIGDIARRPFTGLRILDFGVAHGAIDPVSGKNPQ
jgi:hypothetical protein